MGLKKKRQDGARGVEGVAETPKPGDERLSRSSALVVGNNKLAASEVHLLYQLAGFPGTEVQILTAVLPGAEELGAGGVCWLHPHAGAAGSWLLKALLAYVRLFSPLTCC